MVTIFESKGGISEIELKSLRKYTSSVVTQTIHNPRRNLFYISIHRDPRPGKVALINERYGINPLNY